jgi:hypothetical protein
VRKCREHTSTAIFTTAFDDIANKYADNNNLRAAKIEEFLIAEGVTAGVMTKTVITESKNPNKWDKHMAPWFDQDCKKAK